MYLQFAALNVYKLDPNDKRQAARLAKWTSHSIRIGACVLLYANGFTILQLQFILRWKSMAFRDYLRNVPILAQQQSVAMNQNGSMPFPFAPAGNRQ